VNLWLFGISVICIMHTGICETEGDLTLSTLTGILAVHSSGVLDSSLIGCCKCAGLI